MPTQAKPPWASTPSVRGAGQPLVTLPHSGPEVYLGTIVAQSKTHKLPLFLLCFENNFKKRRLPFPLTAVVLVKEEQAEQAPS